MQEVLKPLIMGTTDSPKREQVSSQHTDSDGGNMDTTPVQETITCSLPVSASFTTKCRRDSQSSGSSSSSMGDVCRICHCESEPGAILISPCNCAGSLKYVHQACLQQWIKSANTKSCELCKFDFHMTTRVKPFRKWESLEMSPMERRKIMCSVTFHFIAITCVVWSLYVLIDRTTEEIRVGKLEWPFWTKLIVVAIGFTGGVVFMYVQCTMYVQQCRRWRAYNRVIYIQNSPPKNAQKIPLNTQQTQRGADDGGPTCKVLSLPHTTTTSSCVQETELL